MTPSEGYRDEKGPGYELRLLKDLLTTVRNIEAKVEEILDELKGHLSELGGSGNAWSERDFYGNDAYEAD